MFYFCTQLAHGDENKSIENNSLVWIYEYETHHYCWVHPVKTTVNCEKTKTISKRPLKKQFMNCSEINVRIRFWWLYLNGKMWSLFVFCFRFYLRINFSRMTDSIKLKNDFQKLEMEKKLRIKKCPSILFFLFFWEKSRAQVWTVFLVGKFPSVLKLKSKSFSQRRCPLSGDRPFNKPRWETSQLTARRLC